MTDRREMIGDDWQTMQKIQCGKTNCSRLDFISCWILLCMSFTTVSCSIFNFSTYNANHNVTQTPGSSLESLCNRPFRANPSPTIAHFCSVPPMLCCMIICAFLKFLEDSANIVVLYTGLSQVYLKFLLQEGISNIPQHFYSTFSESTKTMMESP